MRQRLCAWSLCRIIIKDSNLRTGTPRHTWQYRKVRVLQNSEKLCLSLESTSRSAFVYRGGREVRRYRGQNAEFLALLAVRRDQQPQDALVSADELRGYGRWVKKADAKKVGKAASPLLIELAKLGADGLIRHAGKTKGWQLAGAIDVEWVPSFEEVRWWLNDIRRDTIAEDAGFIPHALYDWIAPFVRGLVAMSTGDFPEALREAEKAIAHRQESDLLGAVAESLRVRVLVRMGQEPDEVPRIDCLPGYVGDGLRARLAALRVVYFGNTEADVDQEILRNERSRLEKVPDLNGLASVENARGLAARRDGEYENSKCYLRLAIVYAAATLDLHTLQGAIFNFAETLAEAGTSTRELRRALTLIALDRLMWERLRVGGDSAQAEIIAATIALRLGDLAGARDWLLRGEEIVAQTNRLYDRAGLQAVAVDIAAVEAWLSGRSSTDAAPALYKDLAEALETFHEAMRGAPRVEAALRDLRKGQWPARWRADLFVTPKDSGTD